MSRPPEPPSRRRGNRLGFLIFQAALRATGLRGAYGLLYFVCLHYLVWDAAARAQAAPYVCHRFPGIGAAGRWLATYRLFISQGKCLIDRVAHCRGVRRLDLDLRGREVLAELTAAGPGFIVLTAHVGNWQLAMTALDTLDREVFLVMRPEDSPAVRDAVGVDRDTGRVHVLPPTGPLGGSVEIVNALAAGHVVSFMGDRTYGRRDVEVDFLGAPARFPLGPFHVAATVGCPILVLLSAKVGTTRYVVDARHVLYPRLAGRRDRVGQLRPYAQQFADLLGDHAREYPYQNFLFADAWNQPRAGDAP